MKIRYKLPLVILSAVIVIIAWLSYLSYSANKKVLLKKIDAFANEMLDATSYELDLKFQTVEGLAEGLAITLQSVKHETKEDIANLIKNYLKVTPEAFGSTVAFEPHSFIRDKKLVAPYYYRTPDGLQYKDLDSESYYYLKWDWYKNPIKSGKPMWGDPYYDEGGGDTAMVTYSYPFFKDGKPWGIATVDISLTELTNIVNGLEVEKTGDAFLLTADGRILLMPNKKPDLEHTIFDLAKKLQSDDFLKLSEKMVSGERGFTRLFSPLKNEMVWVAYGPISSTGWLLGITFPEKELFADINTLTKQVVLVAISGLFVVFIIILVISSAISKPITVLAEATKKIGVGECLDHSMISHTAQDEIGVLTKSFCDMSDNLIVTLNELNKEKALLQTAFSSMKDGLLIMDGKWGRVIQSNDAANRLFMLPSSAPLHEHIQAYFDSEPALSQLMKSEKAELRFKLSRRETDDLGPLHLNCLLTCIMENGKVKEKMLYVRDITDQESEERSKRNFLSLISHKLFTPLTAIGGKLMLLKDGLLGELDEKQKKQIDDMAIQSSKLQALVQSLVNFVTLEHSEFDKSKEDINIKEIIEEVVKTYSEWYADKKPKFKVEISPDAEELSFNKKYLLSLLGQIVDNGIKFNMSEPVTIDIAVMKSSGRTAIAIKDNGIGIPPEYHDKIFTKFYQIDKYFTGNVEGVGLGLTYVRDIIEYFDGAIKLTSAPGKGTIVTVEL